MLICLVLQLLGYVVVKLESHALQIYGPKKCFPQRQHTLPLALYITLCVRQHSQILQFEGVNSINNFRDFPFPMNYSSNKIWFSSLESQYYSVKLMHSVFKM